MQLPVVYNKYTKAVQVVYIIYQFLNASILNDIFLLAFEPPLYCYKVYVFITFIHFFINPENIYCMFFEFIIY